MRIQTKLVLALGALFALVAFLAILSGIYINRLSADTKNILVANYNSVSYSREMLLALDEGIQSPQVQQKFEVQLKRQKENITEPDELEATERVNADFEQIKNAPPDSFLTRQIRKDLADIMLLNMQAIQRKSAIAGKTADKAIVWIAVSGTLCFIIAFTLLLNLPAAISNPIKALTSSIRSITSKNYSQRIYYNKPDEFGDMAKAFNTMAQKLEEYNNSNLARLMNEKQRIETLINNIHEPVIGLDENKKVIFINEEAARITNIQPADVLGKPVQDLAVSNDLIRMLIRDFFEPVAAQVPLKIYADNKESYFDKAIIPISIVPTGETEARHLGDVIFLKNITPFKELDYAKTNFIATVSHELKTPISSIKMSAQLLENHRIGNLNAEQKELVESIQDDAARLLKITSELLNVTQLESGKLQLQPVLCRPEELIQKALQINETAAASRNIHIQVQLPPDLPFLNVDADKTAWIFSNLISNAIRYSHENSPVTVTVAASKEEIRFSVKDHGQGIAPFYLDKIFDRYFRIPGSKKEGTGLGLSISKELIEAQGGSIGVHSEFGAGTEFTVTLPVANNN
ncbi:sensor histidine kinase [Niabella drilacis]|uniref:histidine kinase n=1 Tax=Niabella drilacis (strain DSM 25811 / CCM 8410 / CCUG 62505 / LMG 26954 / E90) TaxID=1285928 RepID=A0A1G6J7R9_NIADE|nr:ATP-binding protein [Niabella drilacis]SDC14613.1 PAS/PAC sensor signal transduction histidine kinase [Niabella drilacis]